MVYRRFVTVGLSLLACALPLPARSDQWPTYAGGPRRLFFNPAETQITPANVTGLREKWRFPTGAIITASPSVALIDLPGEGPTKMVFVPSWDLALYALRWRDGSQVWRFVAPDRPGVSFPNVASVDVTTVGGVPQVHFPSGQTLHALDARTGVERWRFDAGTGCVAPPGLCGFSGERNEIESSPIVADGKVVFGMDVNDRDGGKGGVFAVDVTDGRLAWFFDLESGLVCRPDPGDDIRRYDGYHSESELGLPAGFLTSRAGCDHPRTPNGCGNVWSSAAFDVARGRLFLASSNCDTDANPATLRPPPPMPPYDEAIFALATDGTPVWRWRPREVDNADLAFGAVPNLFTIDVDGSPRDVVGIGNKDGTYYVIDRDGVNAHSGVRHDDTDPSGLPYWRTNVVPGGSAGGIIATAAVDEATGRVYFSTAPGTSVFSPQRPTVHALDVHSGAIVWQNTAEPSAESSFAPTSAIPGVVFAGAAVGGYLRAYDAGVGTKLGAWLIDFTLASAPAIVDGLAVLGGGSGQRSANTSDTAHLASFVPVDVTALCVRGTPACDEDQDGADFPEDCDDRDPTRHPGSREVGGNAIDEDCDGFVADLRDACLAGGSAAQDRRDLTAVLGSMDTACACATFDGGAGRARGNYRRCVRPIIGTAVQGGVLRRACKKLLTRSTCGRPNAVVCCSERLPSGRRSCRATSVARCIDGPTVDRRIETGASHCAATDCTLILPTTSTTTIAPSTTTTTSTTTTSTTSTTLPPAWAVLHAAVIGPACGGCHGGAGVAGLGGLDACASGHGALVGVPSTQLPSMNRVEPGDGAASWLMHKLDGTQGTFTCPSTCGSSMPLAQPLLSIAERDALRAWITAGALNDCP